MGHISGWEIISLVGSIVYLLAATYAMFRFLRKKGVEIIQQAVHPIVREITPNGGSSMKDQMNRMGQDVAVIRQALADNKEQAEKDVIRLDGSIILVNKRIDEIVTRR